MPSVGGKFSDSYVELHRFVRRPGIESNIRLLTPMEFHADTTELVQMLREGHHGVQLDAEAWDRLVTWIDLNAPYHGTWSEIVGEAAVRNVNRRARDMRQRYTGMSDDPEAIPETSVAATEPIIPEPVAETAQPPLDCSGWPFDTDEARRRQTENGAWQQTVDLGDGRKLELVRIPAGQFVMGDAQGHPDERPQAVVTIERPFWMSRCEVTNEQFTLYDAAHDSGVEPMHGYQFGIHGYPRQPATSTGGARVVERGHGLLPLAQPADRATIQPADGSPMGIRLSRGHGQPVLVRRPGCRFLQVGQPG